MLSDGLSSETSRTLPGMAEPLSRDPEMFPDLTEPQIARLEPVGTRRKFRAGEILFRPGDFGRPMHVVLDGALIVEVPSPTGPRLITVHRHGGFTGETGVLAGRQSLVSGRTEEDSVVLEIDRETLRRVVQTDPELSDIFMRAFL